MIFHFANDVKHLREGKLVFCKDRLSEIVENTIAVLPLVALRTLSGRSLLDCVCTARVRTRHPVGPQVITQGLQTVLLVRQKHLADALSASHAMVVYELQS